MKKSTARPKTKYHAGCKYQKKCFNIFVCKHHANHTYPSAFETKPRNTGNRGGAGRASSVDRVLVLVDTVLDDVLVDVVVTDFVFVDDAVVVMMVDDVVDDVQLEVGILDRTQQVMLLLEGFCT